MSDPIEFDDHYDRKLLNFLEAVERSNLQQLLLDFRSNNPSLFSEFRSAIINIPTK